jgi:thiopurine S-methyltransferase
VDGAAQHEAASPDYWRGRWEDGRTGWHRDGINPALAQWWGSLEVDPAAAVLVPLCGASLDLRWLAGQGHRVVGVEASGLALERFFAEAEVEPEERRVGAYRLLEAGTVHLFEGDWFGFEAVGAGPFPAAYDRAALIAMPPELREAYMAQLHHLLAPGGTLLLVTFEYPPGAREGPPFSVEEDELHRLSLGRFEVEQLERIDLGAQEGQDAETAARGEFEVVFRLTRLPDEA